MLSRDAPAERGPLIFDMDSPASEKVLFPCVQRSNILKFIWSRRRFPGAKGVVSCPKCVSLTDASATSSILSPTRSKTGATAPPCAKSAKGFGIKSPNGVMCHLKALEKKGLIKREEHSARAIQIIDHTPGWRGLPMLGTVAAGTPTLAVAQDERIEFQEIFGGPDRFVLKVPATR